LANYGDIVFAGTNKGNFKYSNNKWVEINNKIIGNGAATAFCVKGDSIFAAINGVYLSVDTGLNWSATGLPTFNTINSIYSQGDTIFAGSSLGCAYLSNNHGNSWTQDSIVPGSSIYSFLKTGNNIFAGTWGPDVYLSTNNGHKWTADTIGMSVESSYINSLVSIGNNIFAATTNGVYISSNNGKNWVADTTGLPGNCYVTSIAGNGENIFAGTDYNGIYMSNIPGGNWVSVNTGLPSSYVYSMAAGGNNIFAAVGDSGVFIYSKTNKSWSQISTGLGLVSYLYLKEQYIFAIVINEYSFYGYLYISPDTGKTWTHVSTPDIPVSEANIAFDSLYIYYSTEFGVYRELISALGLQNLTSVSKSLSEVNNTDVKIYPNPVSDNLTISVPDAQNQMSFSIYNLNGIELYSSVITDNITNINFTGFNNGVYIIKIFTPENGIITGKLIKI
jgi:hypothetical protein